MLHRDILFLREGKLGSGSIGKSLNPQAFTNISTTLREALCHSFRWELPRIDSHLISEDQSEKFLLQTCDDLLIEMVLMPHAHRTTLCISCQVGCKMGCTFCQTGKMGFKRNLSAGEISSQLFMANQLRKVTNVVFMGMGEPLDNYDEVVKACTVMIAPQGDAAAAQSIGVSLELVRSFRRWKGGVDSLERVVNESGERLGDLLSDTVLPLSERVIAREQLRQLLAILSPDERTALLRHFDVPSVNDNEADSACPKKAHAALRKVRRAACGIS